MSTRRIIEWIRRYLQLPTCQPDQIPSAKGDASKIRSPSSLSDRVVPWPESVQLLLEESLEMARARSISEVEKP